MKHFGFGYRTFSRTVCRNLCRTFRRNALGIFVATTAFISFGVLFTVYYISDYNFQLNNKRDLIFTAIGSRDVTELVQPWVDTTVFTAEMKIGKYEKFDTTPPYVLIMINSLPENKERRDIIRRTWAQGAMNYGVMVCFFTGRQHDMKALYMEALKYGDLIVDDFQESYYRLTIKTLRMLKWFVHYVPRAPYFVKCDDDVYVNVGNLFKYLNASHEPVLRRPNAYFYGGDIYTDLMPGTSPRVSWYAPSSLWPSDQSYPNFAAGPFYILSGRTVKKMLETSVDFPVYHLEDVFLGMLAKHIGISPVTIPRVYTNTKFRWAPFQYLYFYFHSTAAQDVISYHCSSQHFLIEVIYSNSHKSALTTIER